MFKYFEAIEELPKELKTPIVKVLELFREEIAETVKRSDFERFERATGENFNRVWRTIGELAEAQKELAEAQKRTEEEVRRLAIKVNDLSIGRRTSVRRWEALQGAPLMPSRMRHTGCSLRPSKRDMASSSKNGSSGR